MTSHPASAPSTTSWETIVGMETHVQLDTRTKMYCGCLNAFGDYPNTHVCPTCLGWPGSLPVVNAEAVRLGIKIALALGCTVNQTSQFSRKNYFYPDLPKGYQISQYEYPIGEHGALTIRLSDGTTKSIRIRRVHLEEDTAKLLHLDSGETLLDHNRAGVPLMEIVTMPDLRSPEEAEAYLRELQGILRNLGASQANMEEGQMRCEANISVKAYLVGFARLRNGQLEIVKFPEESWPASEFSARWFLSEHAAKKRWEDLKRLWSSPDSPPEYPGYDFQIFRVSPDQEDQLAVGQSGLFVKTEVKNLNSFRHVVDAIKYESNRYRSLDGELALLLKAETRGWDEKKNATFVMRVKETAADYRYFPEPDLPLLVIPPEQIELLRSTLEKSPLALKSELMTEYGLDYYTSDLLVEREAAQFFRDTLALGADAREAAIWITGETYRLMNVLGVELAALPITPSHLTSLLTAISSGKISKPQGKEVWEAAIREGGSIEDIIKSRGLEQVSDTGALIVLIDQLLDESTPLVEQYLDGKEALLGAFIGKAMKASGGKANPTLLPELIKQRLEARRAS